MNEVEYIDIMKNALQRQILVYGIIFVFACCLVISSSVRLLKKSKRSPQRLYIDLTLGIIVAIAIVSLFLLRSGPLWRDIKYKQIVEIHGSYYFDTKHVPHRLGIQNAYVNVEIEGKAYTLDLPADWDKEDFPFGTFEGKIVYAKESKLILEFVPDRTGD